MSLEIIQPLKITSKATPVDPLRLESAGSKVSHRLQNQEYGDHNDLCCIGDKHLLHSGFRIPPCGAAERKDD